MRLTLFGALTLTLLAGAARAEETHEIKKADSKAAVGVRSTASVTIAAKNGWKVNEEAPISVKLTSEPGVKLEKDKLKTGDLAQRTKELARFDVAFTAGEPGKKTINAEAKFVMCMATTCKPVTEKIALAVDVAAKK
jgi:hypothetical protein